MLLRHGDFLGPVEAGFEWPAATIRRIVGGSPIEPHEHDGLPHFVLVTKGTYASEARRRSFDSPVLIYNPAGISHRDRFLGSGELLAIAPSAALAADPCFAALPDSPRCASEAGARRFSGRLRPLLEAPARNAALAVEEAVLELLAAVAGDRIGAERSAPLWLQPYCDDIRRDPFGSVADRAAEFGLHPVYAARTVRRFTGCSPSRLARMARLEAAAKLLRGSSMSIAAIAADQGFADQAHLTRLFSAHFGTTPRAFRAAFG